ncbi:carboxy-cis,cis-muconate cyclase [Bifidobacterium hapali]|uniref:Carboxy-cis,cis-muconate cyclase n=2 Tax=Bifidobacterium hapali TaxID=1630172 RepID=A0A261G5K8_9BIFI|nr:carboxy-cis,cis-muconate cyclase [Bifidobacterium hapali]
MRAVTLDTRDTQHDETIYRGRLDGMAEHIDNDITSATSADATLAIGGFGPLNGSHCPGIEAVTLHIPPSTHADDNHESVALSKRDGLLADVPSPSWLERDCDYLYAVLENTNEIAAFHIEHDSNDTLHLTELSRVPTPGNGPTHAAIAVDDLGAKHLIVACYVDGHVCVHPIDSDGAVHEATQVLTGEGHGPLPAQEGPHAHWILPLPDGRVLSTDLGTDRIYVHHWQAGTLTRVGTVTVTPGTGPRDMHLLPVRTGHIPTHDWRVAVVGEWGRTVTLLGPVNNDEADRTHNATDDSSDGISVLQTVELGGTDRDQSASLAFVPWSAMRNNCADNADNRTGIAYVGLRGTERIVALAWDGERLSRLAPTDQPGWQGHGIDCGGSRPRHILPIDNLLLVANEVSDHLTAFQLSSDGEPRRVTDLATGSPTVSVVF